MNDTPVRVRIAPSPTGEPHVGTAYIALFNLAFARKNGGKFILRIEDTDRERSHAEWERQIMQGLTWLGLEWDEGPDVGGPHAPYRQSERSAIYREHIEILLNNGTAYRCFCTKERLDAVRAEQEKNKAENRGYDGHCRHLQQEEVARLLHEKAPHVVRMKVPPSDQIPQVVDGLRGPVREKDYLDDQVLLKSDGFPTYHLANVVDDHLMGISHVIRAEEWISSTPKHLLLYQAFGWQPPQFIHMPLLRNVDKSKISKRKNPVSILDYQQRGFLPQAVVNYLAMLGFTMPDGREVFTFNEFAAEFDFARISLGGPVFDLQKLAWLNGKYYREKLSEAELTRYVRDTLFSESAIAKIVPLIKERIDVLEQFVPATEYFFSGDVAVTPESFANKKSKKTLAETRELLEAYSEALDKHIDFSADAIEAMSRKFAEDQKAGTKELFPAIRTAVTGREATPPLFATMSVLGRARCRRRLRHAIEVLKSAKG
ncbi:MAG: glutamate--tRNA ligase [Deltaproteobacteria bacterium]|nr:glutamate--tRNA ligase [Deltaproteobacteria bacterium]